MFGDVSATKSAVVALVFSILTLNSIALTFRKSLKNSIKSIQYVWNNFRKFLKMIEKSNLSLNLEAGTQNIVVSMYGRKYGVLVFSECI